MIAVAEMKDMFSFWRSYYDALLLLPDGDAGRLVKAMCRFAFDGEASDLSDSPMLALAWTMVSGSVYESRQKFLKDQANGRRGGRPRKETPPLTGGKTPPETPPETVSKYVSTSGVCAPSQEAQALDADECGGGPPDGDGPPDGPTIREQAEALLRATGG